MRDLVQAAHLIGVLGHFGWAGVDLFFVLSGYLIASQYFARAVAPGTFGLVRGFYIRRFLRTLPPYFVVLAITYVVTVYGLGQGAAWPSLWTYALFLQNFGMPVASFFVSWSLCVEEHFYLVLLCSRAGSLGPRQPAAGHGCLRPRSARGACHSHRWRG